jgi:hypothetical protein
MFAALVLGLGAATDLLAQYAPPPLQPVDPLKAVPALNSVPAQAPAQPLQAVPPLKPVKDIRDKYTQPICTGSDAKLCAPCVKKCGESICSAWHLQCDNKGVPRFVNPNGPFIDHAGMKRAEYLVCIRKQCTYGVIGSPSGYDPGKATVSWHQNRCLSADIKATCGDLWVATKSPSGNLFPVDPADQPRCNCQPADEASHGPR